MTNSREYELQRALERSGERFARIMTDLEALLQPAGLWREALAIVAKQQTESARLSFVELEKMRALEASRKKKE